MLAAGLTSGKKKPAQKIERDFYTFSGFAALFLR
jgi:hypothetical protein